MESTNVNRLRRARNIQAESEGPIECMFPDSFRILRNTLNSGGSGVDREFKHKSVGRNEYVWISTTEVQEVAVVTYDLKMSGHQARNYIRC